MRVHLYLCLYCFNLLSNVHSLKFFVCLFFFLCNKYHVGYYDGCCAGYYDEYCAGYYEYQGDFGNCCCCCCYCCWLTNPVVCIHREAELRFAINSVKLDGSYYESVYESICNWLRGFWTFVICDKLFLKRDQ